MSDYWSRKPFITHDGVDENGNRAEVQIRVGFGAIADVVAANNGDAKRIDFETGSPKGYKNSGWVNDADAIEKLQKLQEQGTPLHYRIETVRKKGIDRTLPFEEISGSMDKARDNLFKRLVAFGEDQDNLTFLSTAVTNPAEDPGQEGEYSAFGKDLAPSPAQSAGASQRGGFESAPHMLRNPDGSINPGSYGVSAPISMFTFVREYERGDDLFAPADNDERWAVAKTLLLAANRLQMGIYNNTLQKPDLVAGSHTRARALVFDAVRSGHPLTVAIGTDKDARKDWVQSVVQEGLEIWKTSVSILEQIAG